MSACMQSWAARLQLRAGLKLHVDNVNNRVTGIFWKEMHIALKKYIFSY